MKLVGILWCQLMCTVALPLNRVAALHVSDVHISE